MTKPLWLSSWTFIWGLGSTTRVQQQLFNKGA